MDGSVVNVDNFVRAETDRTFATMSGRAGGVNRWAHFREPTPLDQQPVIRMNRDTLYSASIVDISAGATITLPDSRSRYLSLMVVNQDHYINRVIYEPGDYEVTTDEFDTEYVSATVRILVDPADAADVATVNELQDRLVLHAGSARAFQPPEYDTASLDATRSALLELAKGLAGFEGAFGAKADVDPVRHLIGTAAGWGGLPEREAYYLNVDPGLPVGRYRLRVAEVPVDGFWSVSVYNAAGYFPNTGHAVSVNNITAARNADGSITIHFGDWDDATPNRLPIADGWNYLVRLYRPHTEILDGSWTFPAVQPMGT